MAMTAAQIKQSLQRIALALKLGGVGYRTTSKGQSKVLVLTFDNFNGKNFISFQDAIEKCEKLPEADADIIENLNDYFDTVTPLNNTVATISSQKKGDFYLCAPKDNSRFDALVDAAKRLVF